MNAAGEGRVIVGIANTVSGYQALRFAVAYARRTHLLLVAVRAVPVRSAADTWPEVRQSLFDQASAEVTTAFMEALGHIPADLAIAITIESGPPVEVLTSVAIRPQDLLVLGGRDGRRRMPFSVGHTARRCMRRAACPVVTVPAPEMARRHTGRLADDVDLFLRHRQAA
jgi:nucleotide-binding universal stress UspA family protein